LLLHYDVSAWQYCKYSQLSVLRVSCVCVLYTCGYQILNHKHKISKCLNRHSLHADYYNNHILSAKQSQFINKKSIYNAMHAWQKILYFQISILICNGRKHFFFIFTLIIIYSLLKMKRYLQVTILNRNLELVFRAKRFDKGDRKSSPSNRSEM